MAPSYAPLFLSARMSQYGYWIVEVSTAPGERMSIMVAKIGITQHEAIDLVAQASSLYPASARSRQ